jgi:quercetin dioxygenase-like cupin family protein
MDAAVVSFAFESIAWETPAPGVRTKTVVRGGKKLRLVEFGAEFVEPEWCTRGHAGLVLEGEMDLNVDGRVVRLRAGDALLVPCGEQHRHRHHATIATTRLFLVEEI